MASNIGLDSTPLCSNWVLFTDEYYDCLEENNIYNPWVDHSEIDEAASRQEDIDFILENLSGFTEINLNDDGSVKWKKLNGTEKAAYYDYQGLTAI